MRKASKSGWWVTGRKAIGFPWFLYPCFPALRSNNCSAKKTGCLSVLWRRIAATVRRSYCTNFAELI